MTRGALLGLAMLVAACGSSGDDSSSSVRGTAGKDGRIGFDSNRSMTSSPLIPFMTGGERGISLEVTNASDNALLQSESNPKFESSDPTIFVPDVALWLVEGQQDGSKKHGVRLNIKALKQGKAELRVLDGSGASVDRVDIEVADAARIALQDDKGKDLASVDLTTAEKSRKVQAAAFDAKGAPLDADDGFTFTTSDAAIVAVADSCPKGSLICVGDTGNNVMLVPKTAGGATVSVTVATGASASAPVKVTP